MGRSVQSFLRLVGAKDCFVCLPGHVAQPLGGGRLGALMLRLSWEAPAEDGGGRRCAYVSWNGGLSEGDALEVPLALGQTLGLDRVIDADRYARVRFEPLEYVVDAARVEVEPCTSDDWEILEMNAEHIEEELLRQVCVVYVGQIIPIWVHRTNLIMLRVLGAAGAGSSSGNAGTSGCMRLTASAEVVVSPKPRPPRRPAGAAPKLFRRSGRLRVQPLPKQQADSGWWWRQPSWALIHPATLAGLDGACCGSANIVVEAIQGRGCTVGAVSSGVEGADTVGNGGNSGSSSCSGGSGGGMSSEGGSSSGGICSGGGSSDSSSNGSGSGGGGGSGNGRSGGSSSGCSSSGDNSSRLHLPKCGGCRNCAFSGLPSAFLAAICLDDDGSGGSGASNGNGSGANGSAAALARKSRRTQLTAVVLLLPHAGVAPGHLAMAPAVQMRLEAAMLSNARVRLIHSSHGPAWAPATAVAAATAAPATAAVPGSSKRRALGLSLSRLATPHAAWADQAVGVRSGSMSGGGANGGAPLRLSAGLAAAPPAAGAAPQAAELSPRAVRAAFAAWAAAAAAEGPVLLSDGCLLPLRLPPRGAEQSLPTAASVLEVYFIVRLELAAAAERGGAGSGSRGDSPLAAATPDLPAYVLLDEPSATVAAAKVVLQPDTTWAASPGDPFYDGPDASRLGGFAAALRRAVNHFAPRVCRAVAAARNGAPPPGCLLIHGGSGAGKSTLAAALARRLRTSPACFAHTELVQCRVLVGGKTSTVLGKLTSAFCCARARAPSLVVLDDLDALCPATSEDGGAANAQAANIAEHLAGLMEAADDLDCGSRQGRGKPAGGAWAACCCHCGSSGSGESTSGGGSGSGRGSGGGGDGDGGSSRGGESNSCGGSSGSGGGSNDAPGEAPVPKKPTGRAACVCCSGGAGASEDSTRRSVAVVATAQSPDGLQASLSRCRLFDTKLELLPPAPEQRVDILRCLCSCAATSTRRSRTEDTAAQNVVAAASAGAAACGGAVEFAGASAAAGAADAPAAVPDDINWEELAFRTEGCTPRDLVKLVYRAAHHAALRKLRCDGDWASNVANGAASRGGGGGGGSSYGVTSGAGAGALGAAFACHGEGESAALASGGGDGAAGTSGEVLTAASSGSCSGSSGSSSSQITQADFEAALAGFVPESLQGAALFRSSVRWADVGGLASIKTALVDLLQTPVRFRRLYERVPTRLATGALLYGPPGCGKTLVAGAVASECGLSFIAIKGPEVLDKYIGASEAAVRALFARATAAAPCILFFDEFEAMAPRRGNDNTGVTDRVVNQLLTFLDGVEGRSGVYVLAATSRPDLIDPALLRPGRLDRLLYCGFPDANDRLEVLVAASRRLRLAGDVEAALALLAAAPRAASLTGADLQSIVNSAQLEAIHEHLGAADADAGADAGAGGSKVGAAAAAAVARGASAVAEGDSAATAAIAAAQGAGAAASEAVTAKPVKPAVASGVEVAGRHLWAAFRAARPSMSAKDRADFEAAYDKFRGARGADFKPVSAVDDGTLRTTLK